VRITAIVERGVGLDGPRRGGPANAVVDFSGHTVSLVAVTDPVQHARAFGAQMPDAKPSALLDHEARRVSEIDVINGAVARLGARVGVAAPVNATLTAVIKSIERQWS
jgi:ketopantoate reductase